MSNGSSSYRDRPSDGFEEKIVQVNRVPRKQKGETKSDFQS